MIILSEKITLPLLKEIASAGFGDMVKAVVDVEQNLLSLDAELHADLESLLLEKGSSQHALWGINLYPDLSGDDFVEFDSMINLRPSQGNRTRGVDSLVLQNQIRDIVNQWVLR